MAVKEHQMKQKMHKNIVAVYCKDRSGHSVKGSGLLVSNNIVLTCAHILCKKAVRFALILGLWCKIKI